MPKPLTKKQFQPTYQSILDNNSVLYVGASNTIPSYEIAYYPSGSPLFGECVREIVNFIIEDKCQTPFLIHCRLGTDRTGVFCAILAGLCSAEWKDVAGIENLQTLLSDDFIKNGFLTAKEINARKEKLNGSNKK